MYKIYINDLPIRLVQSSTAKAGLGDYNILEFHYESNADLLSIINYAEHFPHAKEIVVWSEDIEALKKDFFNNFIYFEAGGGVVFNQNDEMLLIYRNDKWDLPKGKVKKAESNEEGALREVEEETGVQNLSLICPIKITGTEQTCTYHNYAYNKYRILKATNWYIMETDYTGDLMPQSEEKIEKAEWVPINEVMDRLKDSYKTIIDVAQAAIQKQQKLDTA